MKKKIIFIFILLIAIFLAAQDNPYYIGDGGRGKRLGILELQSENLSIEQMYLPNMLQFGLGDIFTKYSAITVIDRQDLDRIIQETLDPIFTDDWDGIRVAHIPHFDTIMRGIIRKTSTGYTLQISVSSTSTGSRLASHSGNYTEQQLDDHTAIQKAAKDLLTQMGIDLTPKAISELNEVVSRNQIIAQINLAQGVTAQRQGTEVQALSYFFQAATLDPSLFEAVSRSDITIQNLKTGNIGEDARNAIAWRNAWVARLKETEEFFYNVLQNADPPYIFFFVGDKPREGNINYQKETIELFVDYNICPNSKWFSATIGSMIKVAKAVYEGLHATGYINEWGLQDWPNTGVTATNPFNRQWTHELDINMKIVNSDYIIIGELEKANREINRSFQISYNESKNFFIEYAITSSPTQNTSSLVFEVKANEITDLLTILLDNTDNNLRFPVESISRINFDINKRTGKWLTSAQEKEEQDNMASMMLERQDSIKRLQQDFNRYKPGENITFGNNEWIILAKNDTSILVLTKYIIRYRNYDSFEIQKYLNNDFFNGFNEQEKDLIIEQNSSLGTIFLLSVEEAEKYFKKNDNRISSGIWWLRTTGRVSDLICIVGTNGKINKRGRPINTIAGIRPALWISLE